MKCICLQALKRVRSSMQPLGLLAVRRFNSRSLRTLKSHFLILLLPQIRNYVLSGLIRIPSKRRHRVDYCRRRSSTLNQSGLLIRKAWASTRCSYFCLYVLACSGLDTRSSQLNAAACPACCTAL